MNNTNAPNTSSDADMEEPCFGELSASEDVTKSHIYAASNGLFGGSIPVKGGFSSSNGNRINNPPSVSKGRHSDNANKDSNFLSQEGESVSQPVVDVSNENETVDVKDEVGDAKDKSTQPPIPVVRNGNGLFGSTKNTSTPQPSAPSFNGKGLFSKRDDSITQPRLPSFGSGGGLFSKKDDSIPQSTPPSFVGKGLFSTKDDSTPQPPTPSISNSGLFGNKKDEVTDSKNDSIPQSSIPSSGGGLFANSASAKGRLGLSEDNIFNTPFSIPKGGLFGDLNTSSTLLRKDDLAQPTPSFSSSGGGLFGNRKDDSTPQPPAPLFVGKGLFSKRDDLTQPPVSSFAGGGLFGSKKDDSTNKPPALSFGSGGGLFTKKDNYTDSKNDSTSQPSIHSISSSGGLFSKKDDSTPQSTPPSFVGKGLFSTKDDSTPQPPIPSFSNDGGLFSKKDDSTPQPPIPSFSNGGGLFGNKTNDSTDSKNDLADLKDTKDQSADKNDNGESTNGRDDCDNNSTDDKNDSTDAKDAKDESTPNPISDSVPLIIEEEVVSDQEIETDPIIELVSTPYVSMVELVPLPVDLLLSTADLLVEEVCSSIPVPFYQDSQSLYDELENQLLEPIYRADQNLARIAGQISSMRHSLLETRCKVKTLKKMKLDELTEDSLISSLQWGKHTREIHDQKNRLDELLRRVKDTQRLIGIMMDMVNENGMK